VQLNFRTLICLEQGGEAPAPAQNISGSYQLSYTYETGGSFTYSTLKKLRRKKENIYIFFTFFYFNFSGVDAISLDMKYKKMALIGDIDPVNVVSKLRKLCHAEIISIETAKEEKKKGKKERRRKERRKKERRAKEKGHKRGIG